MLKACLRDIIAIVYRGKAKEALPLTIENMRMVSEVKKVYGAKFLGIEKLALERLGKGQSYVSKMERGEQYVDLLGFIEWCEACGTPPSKIIDHI